MQKRSNSTRKNQLKDTKDNTLSYLINTEKLELKKDFTSLSSYQNKINKLDYRILLQKVSKLSQKDLFMSNYQPKLNFYQRLYLKCLIHQRRKDKPIAYLIKQKEFYSRNFYVNKHVLIPRPETEQIIDISKKFHQQSPIKSVLDIGTGSGCLGLTLAKELKNSQVTLLDISKKALKVARKNAKNLNLKPNIIHSNLLQKIPSKIHFDLIITNPPYIPVNTPELVDPATKKYEPSQALFSGEKGLDHYQELFSQIKQKQISFQLLIGEFGFGQKNDLQLLLSQILPNMNCEFYNDLNNIPRIFTLTKSE